MKLSLSEFRFRILKEIANLIYNCVGYVDTTRTTHCTFSFFDAEKNYLRNNRFVKVATFKDDDIYLIDCYGNISSDKKGFLTKARKTKNIEYFDIIQILQCLFIYKNSTKEFDVEETMSEFKTYSEGSSSVKKSLENLNKLQNGRLSLYTKDGQKIICNLDFSKLEILDSSFPLKWTKFNQFINFMDFAEKDDVLYLNVPVYKTSNYNTIKPDDLIVELEELLN